MRYSLLSFLCALTIPCMLWAEPFTATVTEVNASAASNLKETCFYYCLCKNASSCTCTNWVMARSIAGSHCIADSNAGDGGQSIQHTWDIKLYGGDLPVTMRYTATSVTTTGNESSRGVAVNTYTFAAP